MWEGVVFDCDGCLVDSMHKVYRGVTNVFRESGLTPPTKEQFDRTFYNPWLDWFAASGITASGEQIETWYKAGTEFGFCGLFPDAIVLLKHLAHRQIPMAVVSGAPSHPLRENLIANNADHFFRFILGDSSVKTDPIIKFMDGTGLPPNKVVMIGDVLSDIRDGKRAGVWTIGIARSDASRAALIDAHADRVVSSLEELLEVWP